MAVTTAPRVAPPNVRANELNTRSIVSTINDMRQEYAASKPSKWLERPVDSTGQGTGGDYHYRDESQFQYMLEMSRHAERDDPTVGQGISRFVDNVVQGGYTYVPQTGFDAIDRELKDRWATLTADDNVVGIDFQMKNNWRKWQELTARSIVRDGDMGIAPLQNGTLQAFEAHRISSPYSNTFGQIRRRRFVVHGVEQNRQEQVVRYWVSKHENDGFGLRYTQSHSRDLKGVNAWQLDPITGKNEKGFFHLFNPKRFSQSRGVPALHAVLNTAGMHADLQFATLVKAQVASYLGFMHEIPMSASDEYTPPDDELVYDPVSGEMVRRGADLRPGSSFMPQYAGEKITPFTANVPNTEFFDHSKMLLTFIATALDMPLILFMLDASETNFSSWRGAVDQFKIAAKRFQQMHANVFHDAVLRFHQRRWLQQSTTLRRFYQTTSEEYFKHEWRFPKWQHVQPKEDVAAEVLELGNMLDSPRAVASRHNRDIDVIIRETCEDRASAILQGMEKAQELNNHAYIKANPHETVTWREVMPLPLSDTSQMQLLTGDPSAGEKSADEADSPGLQTKAAA